MLAIIRCLTGNKRAAWISMAMFIELNGGTWEPATPDVDDAEAIMFAVAAGSITEAELAGWLSDRVSFEEKGTPGDPSRQAR